jgi:hypothetical protein
LADRIVELAGALVGEILEAQLKERLRDELGPRREAGNQFSEENDPALVGSGVELRAAHALQESRCDLIVIEGKLKHRYVSG